MSKHTPGPWRWAYVDYPYSWREGPRENPDGNFEAIIGPNNEIVGMAEDASSYAASFNATKENKRLIVAAPAMLDLLESLEWSGYDADGSAVCPVCDGDGTHNSDCELYLVLRRAKGD